MAVTNMRIMVRRDTADMWLLNGDNVLLDGEIGYELDSRKMKIGYQSKSYSELPYFAGGIVSVNTAAGLTLNEDGVLSVNNDQVVGELPSGSSMKDYVDGLHQSQGLTLNTEVTRLDNRIDGVNESIDLPSDTTVKAYVDGLIQNEASVRSNIDTIHTSQINARAKLDGAAFTGVITAPAGENVIPFLFADQAAFPAAAGAHGAILHSHADAAMFFAHAGAYHQVLDVNTAYLKTEVDDKFGPLSITGPTGGAFAADNVTDFVSDLLFRDATGDMGGLSMKKYVDEATASLNADIDEIYDKADGSGLIADLGAQINGLDSRLTIVEGKVGVLENKFDVNGDFNGNVIGNTEGTHKGDVVDANGNVIVDVANANFNGNVAGNLTGNTVGSHYGNVYADENGANPGLIINGDTQDVTCATIVTTGAVGVGGTLQVAQAAAFRQYG